ncbi:hypothetical protein ACIBCN_39750 [Nocardia sp. NPDC051052]|uniref:hypothetical protein n=1 Tax=Nocardia sp. NPDC051052 TaxID=3364322 RepID=UPI00379A7569
MNMPAALGYLRKDVSGEAQAWHDTQMRSLAKRLGYNLTKTVIFGADTERPIDALLNVARRTAAEAVIVPSAAHFEGGTIPSDLTKMVDVITVMPEDTHARWSLHPSRWDSRTKGPSQ